jgi:prepilin-type N-terminal cleavage/methylation domain-containing protein
MHKTSGFTLTETLVAMVIGLISIVAAFSAYNYYNKSYASVSQKVTVNKSAREALSLITTDLRNTGYYHVDFESTNCSKLNNSQIDLIGVTNNKKYINGKYKQSDALHLYYSTSAKDQKRVKYELKKYQNSDDYYLMRDVVINPIGHDPSRGCPQWTRTYNMVADQELLIPYVEDFQVIPKDIEGNVVFPVCTSCSNFENTKGGQSESKKNMKKVHTVEIYLTIRSPKEVYPKARKVRIQNGESPYGSNITISNPDKFHRETYFVSVHTRNLAIPQVAVASSGQSISVGSGYNK